MPITRPALRWYGGKWRLAPWIISHLPAHDAYCEPYGEPHCALELPSHPQFEAVGVWGAETRVRVVTRDSVPSADAVHTLVGRPHACPPARPLRR